MKVDYGAVALIPKGDFDATKQYAVNDLVSYNGSSFIVKAVPPIGTLPTNTAYFTINASGTSTATSSTVGTVKPDNSTIGVDNNGVISVKSGVLDHVSSSEQALTVNLLNPTLTTKTAKGITITKNNDGSYKLDGTATEDVYFDLNTTPFRTAKACKLKLLGCPQGGSTQSYLAILAPINARDFGDGAEASLEPNTDYTVKIGAKSGTVCDNLVFKPMLTTNLSATYDDYIPYSGSSGKLDTDYKALSDKIGNVGNTDLQSQLNAATQSIAQNTTDIATNAAGITALNTGLANLKAFQTAQRITNPSWIKEEGEIWYEKNSNLAHVWGDFVSAEATSFSAWDEDMVTGLPKAKMWHRMFINCLTNGGSIVRVNVTPRGTFSYSYHNFSANSEYMFDMWYTCTD